MTPLHDGQHDFDFLLGKWKFHLRRLQNPLTGSKSWIEFDGVGTCRAIWNGKALVEEVDFNGPTGRIEGVMVRGKCGARRAGFAGRHLEGGSERKGRTRPFHPRTRLDRERDTKPPPNSINRERSGRFHPA